MSEPTSFQLWSHLEEAFCQNGVTPGGADSNEILFKSIVRANDARVAEAMVIQGKADPLLALRAYVYRGRLKEAFELALKLTSDVETSARSAEIFLEQARICALNGDWLECENICTHALNLRDIAPVSQLTLLQIRALAYFEMHLVTGAIYDLERVDSLAAIFPNSPSAFYASLLRVKIVALDRSPLAGYELLNRIWNSFAKDPRSNLDRVHALIRAEIYLGFMSGSVSTSALLASFRIAEITGEKLYAALGALEAVRSKAHALVQYFEPLLKDAIHEFPKIKRLVNEINGLAEPISVSAALLSHPVTLRGEAQNKNLLQRLPLISHLFLAKQEVIVSLNPFSIQVLDQHLQLKKALLILSEGEISMPLFFAHLWGRQKYSADLHSNLISSLLYRLKKKTGVTAKISEGLIHLENALVIK